MERWSYNLFQYHSLGIIFQEKVIGIKFEPSEKLEIIRSILKLKIAIKRKLDKIISEDNFWSWAILMHSTPSKIFDEIWFNLT